jgi:hypothetical protein
MTKLARYSMGDYALPTAMCKCIAAERPGEWVFIRCSVKKGAVLTILHKA